MTIIVSLLYIIILYTTIFISNKQYFSYIVIHHKFSSIYTLNTQQSLVKLIQILKKFSFFIFVMCIKVSLMWWLVKYRLFHIISFYNSYQISQDRKSTRLNSSHANISYAVFCLKKKKLHS